MSKAARGTGGCLGVSVVPDPASGPNHPPDLSRRLGEFPCGSEGEEFACDVEDLSSTPGSERSPGGGSGNPLQYCCLENPTVGGAWRATVYGVAKSWTELLHFLSLGVWGPTKMLPPGT